MHIESKCSCPDLAIRAVAGGDTGQSSFSDMMNLKNDWPLPAGGKYTIQVRSNGFTGDCSFAASQSSPHNR